MAATGRGRTSPGAGTERYGDAAAVDAVQHVRTSRTPLPRRQAARPACAGIVIGDVMALVCSALIVSQLGLSPRGDPFFAIVLGACVISVALALLYHGDDARPTPTSNHAGAVLLAITLGAWLLVVGTVTAGWSSADVGTLVGWWGLAVPLVLVVHAAVAALFPPALERALIVGSGDAAKMLTRKLERHSEYRIDVTGTVSVASLVNTMDVRGADRVIVAAEPAERDGALELIRRIRRAGLRVDVVPELLEPIGPGASMGRVEGLPLIHLPDGRLAPTTRAVKRGIDIVGASISLMLTAPLFVVIAVAIKRDSPGPVLFRQTRLGEGMREFTNLKFRTMRTDASQERHRDYIKSIMTSDATPESSGLYKLKREDEITRVGRWLRRTSLDELPELWNVLRGDMSLVGPRPCIPYEVEFFEREHLDRFLVPAGITGLWQVTARARSTFGEALDIDVEYVDSYSLVLDCRILLRTPIQLLRLRSTA